MKRITIGIFTLTAVLAVGVANAGSCPRHMKDIDAALAKSPVLSEEKMSRIKALRAEGEDMHKSGNHYESVKALRKARGMLDI